MTWLIFDAVIIAIFLFCFFANYHKGFISALIGMAAVILSLVLAVWVSGNFTDKIYDDVVRDKLVASVENKIETEDSGFLEKISGGIDAVFGNGTVDGAESNAAQTIVDTTLQSTAKACIKAVLFLAVFLIAAAILKCIARAMRGINKVPILGFANKLCGGLLGVLIGGFYCYLFVSACAFLITVSLDNLSWINTDIISQTKLVSLIYPHNLIAALSNVAV